jgi:hypothetical protein
VTLHDYDEASTTGQTRRASRSHPAVRGAEIAVVMLTSRLFTLLLSASENFLQNFPATSRQPEIAPVHAILLAGR